MQVIQYVKRIDGDYHYLEEIRYGKNNLTLGMTTFYKKRAKPIVKDVREEPPTSTSKTSYSQSPLTKNIAEGAGEVKENLGEC